MNVEVVLQLFNIAVSSHMKFTNFPTSYHLNVISQQNPADCIHIRAAITNT